MKQLSAAEEKFVQNVFKGMTQTKAYIDAYPRAQSYKNNVAAVRASELMRKEHVKDRFEQLKNAVAVKAIISVDERMHLLTGIARDATETSKARMQAIDLLNKMDGIYVNKVDAQVSTPYTVVASQVAAILDER